MKEFQRLNHCGEEDVVGRMLSNLIDGLETQAAGTHPAYMFRAERMADAVRLVETICDGVKIPLAQRHDQTVVQFQLVEENVDALIAVPNRYMRRQVGILQDTTLLKHLSPFPFNGFEGDLVELDEIMKEVGRRSSFFFVMASNCEGSDAQQSFVAADYLIQTNLTFGAIRKFMQMIDDCFDYSKETAHVMVETLDFADEYTGERWYEAN